jgi:HicA-like toxin of HicAB toxin-antitoxin system
MSGYTSELKEILSKAGCYLVRKGRGDHEIWESPISNRRFTVDSSIKSRHTANAVLKQAGLPKAF